MKWPHCKDCKNLIFYCPYGYIVCSEQGTTLGYNEALECPYYKFGEDRKIEFDQDGNMKTIYIPQNRQ